MEIPMNVEGLSGQTLALRTAGLFSGPKLVLDGVEAAETGGKYEIGTAAGTVIPIELKNALFDPVPKVIVNGNPVEVVRPLAWYEYVWMGSPIVLIFVGGAVGGFLGGVAAYSSARIFRSEFPGIVKYVLSAAVSGAAILLYLLIASAIQGALGK